jgi:hypothetical protein
MPVPATIVGRRANVLHVRCSGYLRRQFRMRLRRERRSVANCATPASALPAAGTGSPAMRPARHHNHKSYTFCCLLLLFDLQLLDPHLGTTGRLNRVTAAGWAGVVQRRKRHRLMTIKA